MVYRKLVSHKKVQWWRKQSISSTASVPYLHARADAERGLLNEFEKWLSKEVENPVQPAFEAIRRGQDVSKPDLRNLVKFTAVQLVRTPAFYISYNRLYMNAAKDILSGGGFRLLQNDPSAQRKKHLDIPFSITRIDEANAKVSFAGGRRPWLSLIERASSSYAECLGKNRWHIIKIHPDILLPTSDDPVIVVRDQKPIPVKVNIGMKTKGTEFIFPLSPNRVLYSCVGQRDINTDKLDENILFSRTIYQLVLDNAFAEVYALSRLENMFKDCPRKESQHHYEQYRCFLETWNERNSEIEPKYRYPDDK